MRLLVCGGRDYADADRLCRTLDQFHAATPISILIHGDANGADRMAGVWARANGVHEARVPALWNKYQKAAGMLRNRAMLALKPDAVMAFPGGVGTGGMVRIAREARILVVGPLD